ncbi:MULTISPECIES: enolase C-terminal domain-like protein [unclassified Mesorhizobium]|uniref:enolase C-terminal domain-like protein n=1 Tax=unclassified Mesorhizobium TaxID=325217 RepID=UPI000FD31DD1|nr:enolase C-terminal domain-like protein [Mesorhizobium sp. M7A.F.Ca.MR.362.00.0.0]RUU77174.1 mandelate racemase [Mesorhizobium sp. M7A.F.Ca.MR.362.00.0.0]RWN93584.1 MAG: mandelate racemase [Mesorhizobium sp.]
MKITDIKATTITVPLEAALRHSNGTHWGRFVRTVVEVETDEGIVGLGEMGGGGAGAELAFAGLKSYLVGHDPFDLNRMRYAICNPTASLYNNRTQLHAALEFACLDIIGKKLGVPVYQLLGGRVRDRIGFASYLFFRYADRRSGKGEVRTIDQLLEHAHALKAEHGFHAHKLKAGVFHPDYELECFRALAAEFPADTLRYDPNAALSVEEALRFGQAISDLRNDYFEDPTWGLAGMRRLREKLSIPLATNTIVIDFEQLATNVRDPAVDVILLDTTFWGGIRACVRAAQICDTFGLGIAVHSSGELGIQLATMLHLGAVLPNLVFTADAHYHHLADDIIVGGKMRYENGAIAVPEAPGLGVELDRDKLATYAELYRSLGGYAYDRDPGRPGWYPLLPNTSFADHLNDAVPDLGLG